MRRGDTRQREDPMRGEVWTRRGTFNRGLRHAGKIVGKGIETVARRAGGRFSMDVYGRSRQRGLGKRGGLITTTIFHHLHHLHCRHLHGADPLGQRQEPTQQGTQGERGNAEASLSE